MSKSHFKCPSCGNPLTVTKGEVYKVALHCAVGRCASTAANDGAEGDLEELAFRRLRDAIEKEFENVVEGD